MGGLRCNGGRWLTATRNWSGRFWFLGFIRPIFRKLSAALLGLLFHKVLAAINFKVFVVEIIFQGIGQTGWGVFYLGDLEPSRVFV